MAEPRDEALVVDQMHKWLISIGYSESQIQHEYRVPTKVGSPQRTKAVDLAVFKGTDHTDSNLLFLVECKRDLEIHTGLDQLRAYMRSTGASVGIWFNGKDLTYVAHSEDMFSPEEVVKGVPFGEFVRQRREFLAANDSTYSVRKMADRIGVEPSYLSKIERGIVPAPSDRVMALLAKELQVKETYLFAMNGRLPPAFTRRMQLEPETMVPFLQALENASEETLKKVIQLLNDNHVRDGNW